jgi:hypothetical protein
MNKDQFTNETECEEEDIDVRLYIYWFVNHVCSAQQNHIYKFIYIESKGKSRLQYTAKSRLQFLTMFEIYHLQNQIETFVWHLDMRLPTNFLLLIVHLCPMSDPNHRSVISKSVEFPITIV